MQINYHSKFSGDLFSVKKGELAMNQLLSTNLETKIGKGPLYSSLFI